MTDKVSANYKVQVNDVKQLYHIPKSIFQDWVKEKINLSEVFYRGPGFRPMRYIPVSSMPGVGKL